MMNRMPFAFKPQPYTYTQTGQSHWTLQSSSQGIGVQN